MAPSDLKIIDLRHFANGSVYALETADGYMLETTDTFLPAYTRDCAGGFNGLRDESPGSRAERWMIGVSTMSGCPVHCQFCATGSMKKCRNLTWKEIVAQVKMMADMNIQYAFTDAIEHKINYTRMGEPFMNIENVRHAIEVIDAIYPGTHHYVSTIGLKGSDFSWIKDNITLQISLHATNDEKRKQLIPHPGLMSLQELGQIRTGSKLKTTLNLTLVNKDDFDINVLQEHFDPQHFFVKLSPVNPNDVASHNGIEQGVILTANLL